MIHKNNFDFVRVLAAGLVIYSHMFGIFGLYEPAPFYYYSYGGIGVLIFFSISGYLVSQSWQRDNNPLHFAVKRGLRIFPGLLCVALLMAFVVGPLTTSLPISEYFGSREALTFVPKTVLLILPDHLPGVFDALHYKNVNTSLWTIPLELKWYFITAMLGLAGAFRFRAAVLAMFVFMVAYLFIIRGLEQRHFLLEFGLFFTSGILLNLYSDKIKSWGSNLTAVAACGGIALWLVGQEYLAAIVAIPTLTIAIGTASTKVLNKFGRFGDLSYGLYIYAFPVQQMVAYYLADKVGVYSAMFISIACILVVSFLSWHLIEKPAMKLRKLLGNKQAPTAHASIPVGSVKRPEAA